jgi:hypothetical protein
MSYSLRDIGSFLGTVCRVGVVRVHRNHEMRELSADEDTKRRNPKEYWQEVKDTHVQEFQQSYN